MTRRKWIATGLCTVMFVSVSLAPRTTHAHDDSREDDRPIRLYATASAGPIGRTANDILSGSALTVNGHPASAGQLIWSGDLLQSGREARVPVLLDSIGEVTLARNAAVRLATRYRTLDDGVRALTLIASLVQGDIVVKLDKTASAYLRAAGSEYSSSQGAAFVASVRDGRASIAVKSGEIRTEAQTAQHQYSIRPVGNGSKIRVPAGGLQRLQVQVLEDNKPVPDVAVLFALDTSGAVIGLLGLGTLSGTTANVITDTDGMAAVQFVARNLSGSGPISATVEGTRVSWTGEITVTSKGASRGMGWALATLLGAGAAAGIAYALTRDKGSLQAQPPEVKNP
ncbi:MAG: hypothetical protein AABN33_08205 [Acidobacteriota bacterium]